LSALQSPQPPPSGDILTVLINEITAIPGRVILVLDDYHLIEAEPVHDALTFLLLHLPPQIHLVIATREDPPLPLARLRARGQLTELRATDLWFTLPASSRGLPAATVSCWTIWLKKLCTSSPKASRLSCWGQPSWTD
jgi:LuxR family maltose regulon positive regulatory protein